MRCQLATRCLYDSQSVTVYCRNELGSEAALNADGQAWPISRRCDPGGRVAMTGTTREREALSKAHENTSDDALMQLVAEGQDSAFAILVERHQSYVRRLCSALLADDAAARDAAQEVFLSLWRSSRRYRGDGRLRQLLATIARNRCRSWRRRRFVLTLLSGKRQEQESEEVGPALLRAVVGSPEATVLSDEKALLVRAALLRLPDTFRIPLLLRYRDELGYEEIAATIGRTPATARSRIHYGLRALSLLLPEEVKP